MAVTTSFESLFKRFYRKVESDDEFFNYYNVGIDETLQLAHDRAKGCLFDALDRLASIAGLQVDFSDYDEEIEVINFKTTAKENQLIVGLMFQFYMERDLPSLHAFRLNYTPGDLTVLPPSGERDSYEAFVKRLNTENEIALDDYKSRDRDTGGLKNMINYSITTGT